MEVNSRVVLAVHTDHPFGFGEKNRVTVLVVCDLVAFQADKLVHGRLIVGREPAGARDIHRHPAAFRAVFVFEPVLDYVELKFSNGTYYFSIAKIECKKLGYPSSVSCWIPFSNCLDFIGSILISSLNISGEKLGIPENCKFSPSVNVSPILKLPVS